jgi:hypothetical protein
MTDVWKGLADAVKDIREKVVEEPTWGRALSGPEAPQPEQASEWPQATPGSATYTRDVAPEREPQQKHGQEHDIDR